MRGRMTVGYFVAGFAGIVGAQFKLGLVLTLLLVVTAVAIVIAVDQIQRRRRRRAMLTKRTFE